MEDLTGKQFGMYRITGPLGEGGMAAVFKAFQPSVDRYVAIKVLPRHFANDEQFVRRFEREAKVLAGLQHPNILPVHDYGQADGYTYIVMPFVDSGDLADLMANKSLSLAEIGRIVSQIGDALDYAHSQGVVHRDIKPSNVLVDQRGNCLLTDFGLAKMVAGGSEKLTTTGFVVGTPSYMSPEQGMGEKIDGRSDIYALGVILYELTTGRVPFSAETPIAVVMKHIHDPLLSPREFKKDIPESIERVILKALAKNREDRYTTAGEMVEALQAAIRNPDAELAPVVDPRPPGATEISKIKPSPSKPVSRPVDPSEPSSSALVVWGIVGFLAIVLLVFSVLGVWLFLSSQADDSLPVQAAPEPTQPPAAVATDAPATEAPVAPTETPTPVVQPTSPPTPADDSPPAEPPSSGPPADAPSGQEPSAPPEAVQACQGLSADAACTMTGRGGETLEGSCRHLGPQLACVPAGGPPPRR